MLLHHTRIVKYFLQQFQMVCDAFEFAIPVWAYRQTGFGGNVIEFGDPVVCDQMRSQPHFQCVGVDVCQLFLRTDTDTDLPERVC